MWNYIPFWRCDEPPVLGAPPTYWQLRRFCRWQARQLHQITRAGGAAAAQAREQVAWINSVLRHHPLLDDLQRTIHQTKELLHDLAPDRVF